MEFNSETAVNIFVDVIEDQSGKTYKSRQSHERQSYKNPDFLSCSPQWTTLLYDSRRALKMSRE